MDNQMFLSMMQRLSQPMAAPPATYNPAANSGNMSFDGTNKAPSPAPQSTTAEQNPYTPETALGKITQSFLPSAYAGKGGASGG